MATIHIPSGYQWSARKYKKELRIAALHWMRPVLEFRHVRIITPPPTNTSALH